MGTKLGEFINTSGSSTPGVLAGSDAGTNANDIAVKIGTTLSTASLDTNAKLLSVRADIGGTETEYLSITKNGLSASAFIGDASGLTNLPAAGVPAAEISGAITGALTPYALSSNVSSSFTTPAQITSSLLSYALLSDVSSSFVDNAELTSALLPYALSSNVSASFATFIQVSGAITGGLSGYALSVDISSSFVDNSELTSTLIPYAKSSDISASFTIPTQVSGAITGALTSYATLVGVSSSFTTPAQITSSLLGYALSNDVSSSFVDNAELTSALLPYALSTDISASFTTPTQVSGAITGALSPYATLTGVSGAFASLTDNNTLSGINTFSNEVTASDLLINNNLRVNGTASIAMLETVNQQSLVVGDKYIVIMSGGVDHVGLDGAGILFGSGGTGPTIDENGANAYVRYRNAYDKLEIFPGLRISGSITSSDGISSSVGFIGDGSGLINIPSSAVNLSSYATLSGVSSSFTTPAQVSGAITASSHDPVTLGTANGLSLSGQQLSLAEASTSSAGAITTGVQTLSGNKTLSGSLFVTGSQITLKSLSSDPIIITNAGSGTTETAIVFGTSVSESNISDDFDLAVFKTGIGTANEKRRWDFTISKFYDGIGMRFYNSSETLLGSFGANSIYGFAWNYGYASVGIDAGSRPYMSSTYLGFFGYSGTSWLLDNANSDKNPFLIRWRGNRLPAIPITNTPSSSIALRVGFDSQDNQIDGSPKVISFVTNFATASNPTEKGYITVTGSATNSALSLAANSGSLVLKSDAASGSSDVAVKLGTAVADGTVDSATKLLSVRTGISDSETEKMWVTKDGSIYNSSGRFHGNNIFNGTYVLADGSVTAMFWNTTNIRISAAGVFYTNGGFGYQWGFDTNGLLYSSGIKGVGAYTAAPGVLKLYSDFGTGSTEVVVKAGSSVTASSVDNAAKLFSVRAGIGSTETEYLYVTKNQVSASAFVGDGSGLTNLTVGSGGSDVSASYILVGTTASLPNERQLSASNGLILTDNGAGSTIVLSGINASATENGIVTTGSQTLAGDKTLSGSLLVTGSQFSIAATTRSELKVTNNNLDILLTGSAAGGNQILLDVKNSSGVSQLIAQAGTYSALQAGSGSYPYYVVADAGNKYIAINADDNTGSIYVGGTGYASSINVGTAGSRNISIGNTSGSTAIIMRAGTAGTVISGALNVSGAITASVGGIKFPDGTIQTTAGGGGGSGADVSASYVVIGTTASLPNERQLSASNGLTITDNGAGSTIVLSGINASATQNGIITTGSQTLAGDKTLNASLTVTSSALIGATGSANAAAVLEIYSTTKGVLFPRVSGSARAAMTTATGLIVYQTDTSGSDGEGLYIYKSTGWVQII